MYSVSILCTHHITRLSRNLAADLDICFLSSVAQIIGDNRGPGTFFDFVGVTPHILGLRSVNWMLIIFVPIFAMIFDVAGKVFSNMFYPTQTQIHIELEAKERAQTKQKDRRRLQREREEAGGQTQAPIETSIGQTSNV
jgi:hypothetical protein